MTTHQIDNHPILPKVDEVPPMSSIKPIGVPMLITSGGPAGMSAAIELGEREIGVLLFSDKEHLGGSLSSRRIGSLA